MTLPCGPIYTGKIKPPPAAASQKSVPPKGRPQFLTGSGRLRSGSGGFSGLAVIGRQVVVNAKLSRKESSYDSIHFKLQTANSLRLPGA